jgi:hypothetical protein
MTLLLGALLLLLPGSATAGTPVGTAFTYQGQLTFNGAALTSSCNMQFSLWDSLTGGNQVGSTQALSGVSVSQGVFSVALDFGSSVFTGNAAWLQTAVQCGSDSGYTTLTPRGPITATPYALSVPWAGITNVPPTVNSFAGLSCVANQTTQWTGSTWGCAAPNRLQVALLRWYPAIQTSTTFRVGNGPVGVAFDGEDIWVANQGDNTVTKLRASDGACVNNACTYNANSAFGVAFDGANIWVTNNSNISITKL